MHRRQCYYFHRLSHCCSYYEEVKEYTTVLTWFSLANKHKPSYTDWKLPRKCTDYQLVKPRPYDCNISMQHIATLLSSETPAHFNCDRFWPSALKSMIKKGKQKSFCTLHKHLLSNFLLSWGLPTFQEAVQNVQKSKATPVC